MKKFGYPNGRARFRRIKTLITAIIFVAALFSYLCSGCAKCSACSDEPSAEKYQSVYSGEPSRDKYEPIYSGGDFDDGFRVYEGFSVHYIDVGEGDAVFINFGDGKTMLIDCGLKSERNYKAVSRYIDAYSGGVLDYFMITHTDGDHAGNAADIINAYTVGTAFLPDIMTPENFSAYYAAYSAINEKGVKVVYSAVGKAIMGEDYYLVILSPNAKNTTDSAYSDFDSYPDPPEKVRNDISPIVYLRYKDVKLVFTGDAGFSQENVAIQNVDLGFAGKAIKRADKPDIELENVDFLKVSHHGADDASGYGFLSRLTPKNAVISLSGDNTYGHPKEAVLTRLRAANPDCKVYLTSVCGSVSVVVNDLGVAEIFTAAKTVLDAA